MDVNELLNHGIAAVRSGQRETARQLLAQVIRAAPNHEQAWFWLSMAVDAPQQAIECLERALAINPANQQASERLETLKVVQLLQNDPQEASYSPQSDLRLGEWLVRQGLISKDALAAALKAQQRVTRVSEREPLGTILLRHGTIKAEHLAAAIEYQISRMLHGQLGDGVFRQLGYYLVKYGYLSAPQLAQAITRQTLMAQRGKQVKLGELLIGDRLIRRDQLDAALRAQQQDYDRQFGTGRDKLW